jgi:hypothetical protein
MKLSQILIAAGAASFIAVAASSSASAQSQGCWPLGAKAPVCATKGKMKFTYANAGCAALDGAKVASQGACKAAKPKKAKKAAKKPAKKAAAKKS